MSKIDEIIKTKVNNEEVLKNESGQLRKRLELAEKQQVNSIDPILQFVGDRSRFDVSYRPWNRRYPRLLNQF
jgi:hypothetical protein